MHTRKSGCVAAAATAPVLAVSAAPAMTNGDDVAGRWRDRLWQLRYNFGRSDCRAWRVMPQQRCLHRGAGRRCRLRGIDYRTQDR